MPAAPLLTGVRICMEIYLPQLWELMSVHDPVTIREWYVYEGSIVQPGDHLVEVWTPGRTITIPPPPELVAPHRVVELAKAEQGPLHMSNLLIKLKPIAPFPSA